MKNIALVAAGGAIGSVIRYLISLTYARFSPLATGFPYPTFIANLLGCLLIGIAMAYVMKLPSASQNTVKLLFITGFCGGFTTLSSLSLEVIQLVQNQQVTTAISYVLLSMLLGLALTYGSLIVLK